MIRVVGLEFNPDSIITQKVGVMKDYLPIIYSKITASVILKR